MDWRKNDCRARCGAEHRGMSVGIEKVCERCKQPFECRRADVDSCECALVVIQPWQREWIGKNYADCLCSDCLRAISDVPSEGALHR